MEWGIFLFVVTFVVLFILGLVILWLISTPSGSSKPISRPTIEENIVYKSASPEPATIRQEEEPPVYGVVPEERKKTDIENINNLLGNLSPCLFSSPFLDETLLQREIHDVAPQYDIKSECSTLSELTPPEIYEIHSDASSSTSSIISTPCVVEETKVYCRAPSSDINRIEELGRHGAAVVDACSYSNTILFLLDNGNITQRSTMDSKSENRRIKNNVVFSRLEVFGGYLYGLSSGLLYILDNNTYNTRSWRWCICPWTPINITHLSATLTGTHLWIQSDGQGALYDEEKNLCDVRHMGSKIRIYGIDPMTYIDICHNWKGMVFPEKRPLENIHYAVVNYDGQVIPLSPDESQNYSHIRLINWKPYYITRGKQLGGRDEESY